MSERQYHLLRLLRREPSSTTLEAARSAGCSTRAAWRSLCALVARGMVRFRGCHLKNRVWWAA